MATLKRRLQLRIDTLEARDVPAVIPYSLGDLNPGTGNSNTADKFVSLNGLTYFSAATGPTSQSIYQVDGANAYTEVMPGLTTGNKRPAVIDDRTDPQSDFLLFAANVGGGLGEELYYKLNNGAMTLVKDIHTTASAGSNPELLTTLTVSGVDTVFFTADNGTNGRELWRTTDPLVGAATALVADQSTTPAATAGTVFHDKMFALGSRVYYFAKVNGATSWELFSVGTTGGPSTISGGTLPAGIDPKNFTVGGATGTEMYYTVVDGANNYSLYKIDGSANTLTVAFSTSGATNKMFDGTGQALAYTNGSVYFARQSIAQGGYELWKSTGATGNGTFVADLGPLDSTPRDFAAVNGIVYFSANDGLGNGRQLLRYNTLTLSPPGRAPNADLINTANADPQNLTEFNGQLVYTANDAGGQRTLYQYDTINSTTPKALSGDSDPMNVLPDYTAFGGFTPVGQTLFLELNTGSTGLEPYTLDPLPDAPFINPTITPDSALAGLPATLTDLKTNASVFQITGRANANGQILQIEDMFIPAGSPGGTLPVSFPIASVPADYSYTTFGRWTYNVPSLPEGTHSLRVTAQDATGTSPPTIIGRTVVIDQTAPQEPPITGNNMLNGFAVDLPINVASLTLTGTGGDKDSYLNVYEGDRTGTPLATLIDVQNDGTWTSPLLTGLSEGLHYFYVTATDDVGNSVPGNNSQPFTVFVDTVDPARPVILDFEIDTGRSDTDNITKNTGITLNGTAEADSTVSVYLGGVFQGTAPVDENGDWFYNVVGPLGNAVHAFTVTTADSVGNVSPTSLALNVTVDTMPPAAPTFAGFTVDSGTLGDFLTNATTVTLSGTAAPFAIVTTYEGGMVRGTSAAADASGNWTLITEALSEGAHPLDLTATDVAGNEGVPLTGLTITIDTTPPAIPTIDAVTTDTNVPGDRVTSDNTPTLSGTRDAGTTITLTDGGLSLAGAAIYPTSTTWEFTTPVLSNGLHNFVATATDLAGNPRDSAPAAVTIDTGLPATPTFTAFSIDSGSTGDNLTNDKSLTLTGTAELGADVEVFEGVVSLGLATRSGANWSFTTADLPDGPHTFTFTAKDLAGNVSAVAGTTPAITIDTLGPTGVAVTGVASDTGIPGDGITSDTTLTVSGTAEANTTVRVFDGVSDIGAATLIGTGWTIARSFSEGAHSLTAVATDAAGNVTTSAVFTATVDTAPPPQPVFVSFSDDSGATGDNRTNDTTLTLTGTAEAGTTVTVVEVGVGFTPITATRSGVNWTLVTAALPDGPHTFEVRATDAAGNVSVALTTPTITVDALAPTAPTITTLTDDTGRSAVDGITNDYELRLDGTVTAGQGVIAVDIFDGMTPLGTATLTGTAWFFNTATLTEGTFNFVARARDAAGNSADSAAKVVTVDRTAPAAPGFAAFADDTGLPGDNITKDNTLTLTGTAEADALITVKEGGVTLGTATATGGVWEFTTGILSDGPHTFTATATDVAGSVLAAPGFLTTPTITIDTSAPAGTTINGFVGVSPVNFVTFGLTTSATVITLSGSAGEPGLPIEIFDGADSLGTTTSGQGGVWTFTTIIPLSTGTHDFTAAGVDAAGNNSPPSAVLSVDVDPALTLNFDFTFAEDTGSKTLKGSDLLAVLPAPADSDPNALKGVAVTGLTGTGTWSYAVAGKFVTLDTNALAQTHALLLRDKDSLKFTPAANYFGIARITFQAWDQTGGKFGEFADASVTGTGSPFSATARTLRLGVANTNDRPALLTTDSPLLPSLSALGGNPAGTTVGALLKGRFADVDPFKIPGIAVIGVAGTGSWEFSSTGAAPWTPMGKPSAAKAILLDETYFVRFVPTAGGTATLTYVAWDGSAGGAAGAVNVSTTAAAVKTAFGMVKETATVNVNNTAPVLTLTPGGGPTLKGIAEDTAKPVGDLVSTLVDKTKFTDADAKTVAGIAVTGVDNAFGQWQFSTGGNVWRPLAAATTTNVLLLKGTGKIRFLPNANENGQATITYRAWDGSTGVSGEWADPTGNTAFSVLAETAKVTVTAVNDRPVLTTTGTPTLTPLSTNQTASSIAGTPVSALLGTSLTDVDAGVDPAGIAVVGVTGKGIWQYRRDSGSALPFNAWTTLTGVSAGAAVLLAPDQFVRFVPAVAPALPEIATLKFKGWDRSLGIATGTAKVSTATDLAFSTATETAYVSAGNGAPSLVGTPAAFTPVGEDPKTNAGQAVKTLLGTSTIGNPAPVKGEALGIAVTARDNTGGTWQYALTSKFVDVPAVSAASALLLPATAKLKFVPDANFNGSAGQIIYKSWDQTAGVAGDLADTTLVSSRSAFSTATASPTLTITAVNDRPVVVVGSAIILTPLANGYDKVNNPGDNVSSLVPLGIVTDLADGNTAFGLAVTGLTGAGVWQYYNGSTWIDIVKPTASKAVVVHSSSAVRFTATDAAADGQASITYRAVDLSAGSFTSGQIVNAGSATDTFFSLGSLTATVSVGNSQPTG